MICSADSSTNTAEPQRERRFETLQGEVEAGLALADSLDPDRYHYLHATRAELLRRLDRVDEARAAYDRALELVHSDSERRFLERRLAELSG